MKHIWSVICQKTSIDKETNLLSMFNCVEEIIITLDKEPISSGNFNMPVDFQLVNYWIIENSGKDNELNLKVEIISPNKELLNSFMKDIPIPKGYSRFRNILGFKTIKVSGEGRYFVRILYKKGKILTLVAELPLDIKILHRAPKI